MNAVLTHECASCCLRSTGPMPDNFVTTIPGPPWYCSKKECQERATAGLIGGWTIRPQGCHEWLMGDRLDDLSEHIASADAVDEDIWELRRVFMTEAQWDALPEFGGW